MSDAAASCLLHADDDEGQTTNRSAAFDALCLLGNVVFFNERCNSRCNDGYVKLVIAFFDQKNV